MKNIMIVVPSLTCGGVQRTVSLLANHLVKTKQYNVYIFSLSKMKQYYPLEDKVKVFFVDKYIKYYTSFEKNIKRVNYIAKKIEKLNIDLIIGYTSIGGILSCGLKMKTSIPNIVCERNDPNKSRKITRIARNILYRIASGAIFQTEDAQKYFEKIVKNSVVIPNFIDTDNLPDVLPFENRDNKIVNVGRLEKAKNQELLIKTFYKIHKNFPEYKLDIYGDGSLRNYLSDIISYYNLNNFISLKGLSSQVFDDIKSAKLFVFTSDYEGYPNALLEAMAMGLAVISTDCPIGGPRSMIKDGVNGLLIPLRNEVKLEDAISSCLNNEKKMKTLAIEAQYVRKSNSSAVIFQKWINFINESLA